MHASLPSIDTFLYPGQFFVGDARHRVRTLLGSCVAITLWHPQLRVGAMSHFLLSSREQGTSAALDARYGEESLQLMLDELKRRRVPATQCEAKVFGGGDMFPNRLSRGPLHVGRRNGEAARRLLHAAGIAVKSESLFGEGHRKIAFDIATGDVWTAHVPLADHLPTLP
jgi:chemotaxis protein CheD